MGDCKLVLHVLSDLLNFGLGISKDIQSERVFGKGMVVQVQVADVSLELLLGRKRSLNAVDWMFLRWNSSVGCFFEILTVENRLHQAVLAKFANHL